MSTDEGYEVTTPTAAAAPKKNFLRRFFIFLEFPFSVWFIIGNELCERFSFYGFKTILPMYLLDFFKYSKDESTAIVHAFIFFAYFTPLFGSFLADSLIGKFWTILILSVVYCIGQAFVAVTAIPGLLGTPPHWWGLAVGLFLVAVGTGGIKPCVSSFGGDQFKPSQTEMTTSFFALFYFSINLGSTVSTFLTPILRSTLGYAIAFAVPAGLLAVATVIFALGSFSYRKNPPAGNVYLKVFRVMIAAIKHRKDERFKNSESWLDAAKASHPDEMVDDVKSALSVIVLLFPVFIFWSLYDQHSTRWVYQAIDMDRVVFGYELKPEQIQVLNPILIIVLVPIFDRIIFKLIGLVYNLRPLQKISFGFIFTTISFLISAGLQFWIESVPAKTVHCAFQLPQYITMAISEVLVSVTALEFSYAEAPPSMKAVITAFYLLTVAGGNIVVVIVASVPSLPKDLKFKQAYEFIFFSALMVIAFFVYLFIARRYKYQKRGEKEAAADLEFATKGDVGIDERPASVEDEKALLENEQNA